jgi:hypothetical protein
MMTHATAQERVPTTSSDLEGRAAARKAGSSTAIARRVGNPGTRNAESTYRRFVIVAGPYQLFESGCWTVELKIRRNGRGQAFSLAERYPTEQEAVARCHVIGHRIIDGRMPGWSVDHLRIPPRGGALHTRMARAALIIAASAAAVWALGFVVLSALEVTSP